MEGYLPPKTISYCVNSVLADLDETSKRHGEALADCPNGCGKWQVRYDGKRQQSDPYQVRSKASKPVTKSARMSQEGIAAIEAMFGSFQAFVDNVSLLCITRQYIH